ncbi:MAG: HAMP domain-containing histidine kinase [Anaerolineae bacterium]|nr:HAMP domain-containing histidine kinase [Gloeobacterales cyanobacterium ES-bin-313]
MTVSLWGIGLVLSSALNDFFIQDAQSRLSKQALGLASSPHPEWQSAAHLTAFQNQVQVQVYNPRGKLVANAQGVNGVSDVPIPQGIISKTRSGLVQQGRFWIEADSQYPWWLYSTAPIRLGNTDWGAVYIAMPLLRPRLFAQKVTGLVMACVGGALLLAMLAGLGLARMIVDPLKRLAQQAHCLENGDYQARSSLSGADEVARLGYTLDQMAERLEVTIASLKSQERSRRELMANISHDLRTPLTALRLSLDAIIDGIFTADQVGGGLEKMRREVVYLGHLIDQLMLLARSDSGQQEVRLQEVSVVGLLAEALERVEPAAIAKGLFLDGSWPTQLPPVRLDPQLSAQVFANLLDNAIKYTPSGGLITLAVKQISEQELQIMVQDSGPGMDEQTLQRATERFYRADQARSGGGFGLGLAIADRLCQLQDITLQIASVSGQGTTVILSLPLQPVNDPRF